jgi:hypothetical protein
VPFRDQTGPPQELQVRFEVLAERFVAMRIGTKEADWTHLSLDR